jgi:hypothetical protein
LAGNLLKCEFSITSLETNATVRFFSGGNVTDAGIIYKLKSISVGSGRAGTTVDAILTKGVPVTVAISYDGLPLTTRMLDLQRIQIRKTRGQPEFDVDFFDVVVVNQN